MKRTDFNEFRERLIKCEFVGDLMCMTWMFLHLTDNQVGIIKEDAIKHARSFIAYPDGAIKVDCYIFK